MSTRKKYSKFQKILKFWFDRGITGLRLDASRHFVEDGLFRDEKLIPPNIKKEEYEWNDYFHEYTTDQWESYEFMHELRQFVDDINAKEGGPERSGNTY